MQDAHRSVNVNLGGKIVAAPLIYQIVNPLGSLRVSDVPQMVFAWMTI